MNAPYGFDDLKQKEHINQLYKLTVPTTGVNNVVIRAQDLDNTIADWFVIAIAYGTASGGATTYITEAPRYAKRATDLTIEIEIDDTQGAVAEILLQKAKSL